MLLYFQLLEEKQLFGIVIRAQLLFVSQLKEVSIEINYSKQIFIQFYLRSIIFYNFVGRYLKIYNQMQNNGHLKIVFDILEKHVLFFANVEHVLQIEKKKCPGIIASSERHHAMISSAGQI